jgi:hypothetical protein
MSPSDASAHLSLTQTADGGVLVVKFKDEFLNYATSETLAADIKTLCG